jgi:hypothetical protein
MTHTHGRMLAQLAAPVVIFAHMGWSSLGVTCIMMMHTTFTVLVHANCPLLQVNDTMCVLVVNNLFLMLSH